MVPMSRKLCLTDSTRESQVLNSEEKLTKHQGNLMERALKSFQMAQSMRAFSLRGRLMDTVVV